jgi:hypothetical protein
MKKVRVPKVVTPVDATESPLPPQIQEALARPGRGPRPRTTSPNRAFASGDVSGCRACGDMS